MKTRVSLAGVQYCDYQRCGKSLQPGVKLELYPESDNKFDKKAIAVYCREHKIGYIKKGEIQDLLWKARKYKKNVTAKLVAYNKSNPTWYMLTVELDIPVILEGEFTDKSSVYEAQEHECGCKRYLRNLYYNAMESTGDNQYL